MSKIIMKRSELENLIENLLIDGLIAEGFDIGFGSEEDSEEDKDKDKAEDEDKAEDKSDGDTDADDGALAPTDPPGGGSLKRVASTIADKVSKAYTGTKELAGKLYDKLPDAKDVKDSFVGVKNKARELSKEYGSGLLGAAIDVGDAVYDLGDTTYSASKAGVQKLAAVGQDEADIGTYVVRLARMSDRALDNQESAADEGVDGADDDNITAWFDSTSLGDLLSYDQVYSVAGSDPADDSSQCYWMHYFGYTIHALKDVYFAIDRTKKVPKLGHYGIGKYMQLKGKSETHLQNQIIGAINRDLTQLARETNEFHTEIRKDIPNVENFIDVLSDLMHSGNAAEMTLGTVESNIKEAESRNLEPYVFQVYSQIALMLKNSIPIIDIMIKAVNEGFRGRRPRQFKREGKTFAKDEYPCLYHVLEPDKITGIITKYVDVYTDLSNNKVTGKSKRFLKDTLAGGGELGSELGKIAKDIFLPRAGKK